MTVYGLIGFPLGHSFSKKYFTDKFVREGIGGAMYDLFPIKSIDAFPQLWQDHPGLKGLNVTIPYKESVIQYLDEVSDVVKAAGACNCISKRNGRLIGFNTDVIGFETTLRESGGFDHAKALVLGTGGASKAVGYVLKKNGIEARFVSRKPKENQCTYASLDAETMEGHTLIINTTPVGMFPMQDSYPDIPYRYITPKHLLVDLIYNPSLTRFMEEGRKRGATVVNGERMLIVQAEESWNIWNQQ